MDRRSPQPDLNGALFLFWQKKKKAGVEGGKAAINKFKIK